MALFAGVLLLLLALRIDPFPVDSLSDSLAYIAMAEGPLGDHPAPFCYRLLVPTLARTLPLDLSTSFYLLTILFITGTGVVLYYILREIGLSRFYALMGMWLFFGLNWGPRFVLFDYRLTDPGLFFFGAVALLALLRRRRRGSST